VSSQTSFRWSELSKGKAFSIHLALSILIFSSLVAVMLIWWFPGKLFFLDGGWQGLKIVALIDLVLGPALTLLLYKPGKPKLLLDMSLVALIQIAALGYGFYATYNQRTVAVVYADRNFITLSADAAEVAREELIKKEKQPRHIATLDKSKPAMLLTPEPAKGEFKKYMSELLSDDLPEFHERLDLFVKRGPEHAELLSKRAVTEGKLKESGAFEIVEKAVANSNHSPVDIELHRFKARYAAGFLLYSKSEQKILDYVAIPWDKLAVKQTDEKKTDTASNETE